MGCLGWYDSVGTLVYARHPGHRQLRELGTPLGIPMDAIPTNLNFFLRSASESF